MLAPARRRRRLGALQAADGLRPDDPADGRRRVRTRAPTCSATAPAGSSRATAAPAARARSTPRRSSPPAPSTTWPSRSTPGPSGATRPTSSSRWRCDAGCLFSIDSDAHAPGQLDFQVYGCARAERLGVPAERIVNTWEVDRLLEWARPPDPAHRRRAGCPATPARSALIAPREHETGPRQARGGLTLENGPDSPLCFRSPRRIRAAARWAARDLRVNRPGPHRLAA